MFNFSKDRYRLVTIALVLAAVVSIFTQDSTPFSWTLLGCGIGLLLAKIED
jgi:hypothetical protein